MLRRAASLVAPRRLQACTPPRLLSRWLSTEQFQARPTEASPLGSSSAFTPPEPDMFEEKIDMPFHSSTANPEEFLVYRQPMYERFVNMLMMDGKKQTARKILWKTFGQIRDRGHNPHAVFEGALANVLPMMEMRNSKAGKGMVPYPLAPRRAEGIAMKWLVGSARKRNASGNMDDRLCNELLQAYQNRGAAVGKREAVHKTALANQAGAHFRWRGGALEPGAVNMDSRKTFRHGGRRAIKKLQRAFKRRS